MTIFVLLFSLVMLIRRRFCHGSKNFRHETKSSRNYHDIWREIGKTRQINRKHLAIREKVGQGCFGDVYRGQLQLNEHKKTMEVAIKVSHDRNSSSMHDLLFEANRMKDFSHPNVLSLIGVSWDSSHKAMVVLPYMKNGDLRSYMTNEQSRPTIRQLIVWGIQVADGMEYLSSLKFVHRDLATRNCMLDEQLTCRISDFGLSRDVIDQDYYIVPIIVRERNRKAVQTTPRRLPIRWLSPETIEASKYTTQSDVVGFNLIQFY